jgi:multiple sugar transport system ATP-binding protein
MDEPLSNLDAQLRVQTREELLRLQQRLQTTTIYVTHDQIEAMTMGHRIVVMRGGVVQQIGKPQDVYDHPVNTFVAAFLGSPRINLHSGAIETGDGGPHFVAGGSRVPLNARLAGYVSSANGGEAAIGVRPEDIAVLGVSETAPSSEHVLIQGTVNLVEPVGSDLYVNTTTGEGVTWMARTDPRLRVSAGDNVHLALNLEHAHLFGADGRNLELGG